MTNSTILEDLSSEIDSNIRLGIQGPPGCGKTYAAMSFPNPVVANWDKGLQEFAGSISILQYRLYSPEWIKDKLGIGPDMSHGKAYPNYETVIRKLFSEHLCKLESNQTLIWDSYTSFANAFYSWNFSEKWYTKKGEEDVYEYWSKWVDVQKALHSGFQSLKCNVVVIFHSASVRDPATGKLLDKEQPLVQGKFVAELKGKYPFFFKQFVKQDTDGKLNWLWQTQSDNTFDAKCVLKLPAIIPATYDSFKSKLIPA